VESFKFDIDVSDEIDLECGFGSLPEGFNKVTFNADFNSEKVSIGT